jgi:subtilase family serine protease
MKAFNTAVQKLALRGVSVLASSGDDGVANQRAREDDGYCGFYPSFPASSPYVLAVGATRGPGGPPPLLAALLDLIWRLRLPLLGAPAPLLDFLRYPWVLDSSRLTEELGFTFQHSSREALAIMLRAKGMLA